jgi:hypothetical protein
MPLDHVSAGTVLQAGGPASRRHLPRFSRMAAHVVTMALALSLMPLSLTSGYAAPARMMMQVAGQYSSTSAAPSKSHSQRFDPDAPDKSWKRSTGSRVGDSRRSPPSGYNPDRIKHFWQHYHPDNREKKAKPLDREK